jgi:hypothetical protein
MNLHRRGDMRSRSNTPQPAEFLSGMIRQLRAEGVDLTGFQRVSAQHPAGSPWERPAFSWGASVMHLSCSPENSGNSQKNNGGSGGARTQWAVLLQVSNALICMEIA